MKSNSGKGLGDHPLVVTVGVIAGLVAIFIFATGYQSIPDILKRIFATPTPALSTQQSSPVTTQLVSPVATVVQQSSTKAALTVSTATPAFAISTVSVSGKQEWQSTGVAVDKGQLIRISYKTGQWATRIGFGPSLPDVWTDAGGVNQEIFYPEIGVTARLGSLIGRIGNGSTIKIGLSFAFISDQAGMLFLRMHDTDMSDNDGAIEAEIKVSP